MCVYLHNLTLAISSQINGFRTNTYVRRTHFATQTHIYATDAYMNEHEFVKSMGHVSLYKLFFIVFIYVCEPYSGEKKCKYDSF